MSISLYQVVLTSQTSENTMRLARDATLDSMILEPVSGKFTSKAVEQLARIGFYKRLATFSTSDLDEAFSIGNDPEKRAQIEYKLPFCRSPSCGDIFLKNDKYFLITGMGFEEVTHYFV